jgi:hypothetical protein
MAGAGQWWLRLSASAGNNRSFDPSVDLHPLAACGSARWRVNREVYAVATMDTKGEEIAYVAACLRAAGATVKTVDVGTLSPPSVEADVSREEVLGREKSSVSGDRGEAIAEMGQALAKYLLAEHGAGRLAGVLGIGGSGGTALVTAAMRSLPIGLPKVMVSTVASGNTAPYVDSSDITMMYSVVDVAGLNAVSRQVLANAAHAMAGMVQHEVPVERTRPAIGMTMFGVTTPCVTAVREALDHRGAAEQPEWASVALVGGPTKAVPAFHSLSVPPAHRSAQHQRVSSRSDPFTSITCRASCPTGWRSARKPSSGAARSAAPRAIHPKLTTGRARITTEPWTWPPPKRCWAILTTPN